MSSKKFALPDYLLPTPPSATPRPPSQLENLRKALRKGSSNLGGKAADYVKSLFPVAGWLPRYNSTWLVGDVIAGVTVGLVVIPQAIAYSTKLAGLPAQYGLFSSFVGVMLYALFATSKDVTIGPTSVLSLLVGQTIGSYLPANATEGEKITFALTLSFFTGAIQLVLGLLRLGIIVDFIPISVIAGFTTGAGFQIIIGQLPTLTGVKGVNNNDSAYLVLGNWLKSLNQLNLSTQTKHDLAFGLSSLAFIIAFKVISALLTKRHWVFRYIGLLRNGIAVILFTGISFAVRDSAKLSLVGVVPKGFSDVGKANLSDGNLVNTVFRALPAIVLVSILEHMAVVKSYGRLNGYNPDNNQEFVAIGASNLIGSFIGAYPATGSFSRSAIKSQSGVRSPLAALFTGIIVLLSIYLLTPAFYFIPSSVLSAIIVAAITELLVHPRVIRQLWDTQLVDFAGFWIAFFVTIFSSIENAIYSAVAFSFVVLLVRLARPKVATLRKDILSGQWVDDDIPVSYLDGQGRTDLIESPTGVLIVRFNEALTFPNANFLGGRVKTLVKEQYRYTGKVLTKGERSWDDDSANRIRNSDDLPVLRAVVFDFSGVHFVDFTGLEALLEVKEFVGRFTGREVPLFFANVGSEVLRVVWRVVEEKSVERDVEVAEVKKDPRRYFHAALDEAVRVADEFTRGDGVVEAVGIKKAAGSSVAVVGREESAETVDNKEQ
ncbi:hypothetical protein HDU97_004740 [Phlyctochytrium planicorne]|nr:hypothetical protein HDU97_004740 [Phlyctochytrium planicorne]